MLATHYGKDLKIQLLTIEELFAGKKPNIPLVGQTAFKKAQVEPRERHGGYPHPKGAKACAP